MSKLKLSDIPASFPVQPLPESTEPFVGMARCGNCGLLWDDDKPTSWTPVPSGRCPFEYFHKFDAPKDVVRMKPKHTPGPWEACGYKGVVVNDCNGNTLALFPAGDGKIETAQANARLIAAAPDLLEAVVNLLGFIDEIGSDASDMEIANQARAAIRKAEGGSAS